MNYEALKERIWNSDFNKTNYEVSLDVTYLKEDLIRWSLSTNDKASNLAKKLSLELSFEDVLEKIVPKFQRDNDKWSKEMQIKFVENIILGVNTTIILGTLSNEKSECVLIDGLQRVSAIFSFMNKEFKVFENFEYNDDFENKINTFIHNLKLKIFNFKNEKEMVNFYINMNENITHSKEDIQKAKDYLNKLDNVVEYSIKDL